MSRADRVTHRQSRACKLIETKSITAEIFALVFEWRGTSPKAGQFFMIKPARGSVFLGRPISVAAWYPESGRLVFLVAPRGTGTEELLAMRPGEDALLSGPLGNAWSDFMPESPDEKPSALVGGGIGIAPLEALYTEFPRNNFDFYAGFRTAFTGDTERHALLGPAAANPRLVIATEDGSEGVLGRIPDFLEARKYARVFACGPQPMLQAVAARCAAAGVPCFVSLERSMACGVGACLGCTVTTIHGNRRCCADGPIFPAEEIVFDE